MALSSKPAFALVLAAWALLLAAVPAASFATRGPATRGGRPLAPPSSALLRPSAPRTAPSAPSSLRAVEGDFDPDALEKSVSDVQSGSFRARFRALYKFTRPHTIRGTVLASIAGTTRALIDTPGAIANANWNRLLPRAVIGMIALLLGNAFIVGINQIFDRDIDELNKPFLPVASGEMSERWAWIAVALSGTVGPAIV
ncbi:hypothetical protein ACHAWF_001025 [Thalassiosira exigua]